MADKYDPIGYVAGVQLSPKTGGYVPVIHFYEPGQPIRLVWSGNLKPSLIDAISTAETYLMTFALPTPEEVLLSLRRVLDVISNAGNLMAVTANEEVAAARTLVARLGG